MNAWVVMGNEIPHNERNIDASLVATVYGLTGDYDDRVSYTSWYHAIIIYSENYQFNSFGSKSYEFLDRE